MKPNVEINLRYIPRPRLYAGFELQRVWLGFEFTNGHSDPIFQIGIETELSGDQADLLYMAGRKLRVFK